MWKMLLGIAWAVAAAAPAPTVENPGFETLNEQSGLPSGWAFAYLPGKLDLIRYESVTFPDAPEAKALSLTVAAGHPNEAVSYNAYQDVEEIEPGKTYQLAARVRTRGLTTLPMAVVQCLDGSGTQLLAFARTPSRTLTGDVQEWEPITTSVTVPEGTALFRVRIGIPSTGNAGGTAYVDDVSVTELPE
jgi:hypothetical protein